MVAGKIFTQSLWLLIFCWYQYYINPMFESVIVGMILKWCASVIECLSFVNRSNKRSIVELADDEKDATGWGALHSDLMGMIVALLDGTDRVYTSVVCKSWYRILKQNNTPRPPQIPWLLLPHAAIPKTLSFYDLSQAKVREIKLPRSLGYHWYCCGSSKGWLIMITNNLEMFLFNPLSGERHQLPSLKTIPVFNSADYRSFEPHKKKGLNIQNIQLSCEDPLKCTVAAILNSHLVLACCKIRDKAWTIFEGIEGGDEDQCTYELLLFHDGILYSSTIEENDEDDGLKIRARTFNIILGGDINNVVTLKLLPAIVQPREESVLKLYDKFRVKEKGWESHYLIESSNREMLAVIRCEDKFFHINDKDGEGEDPIADNGDEPCQEYYKTRRFDVFKLIPDEDDTGTAFRIQKIESLDEGALFVCKGGSSSVGSSKDGRGNCIYFADDSTYYHPQLSPFVSRENGIFYLTEGNIKRPFPSIQLPHQSKMSWFTPNFIL